MSKNRLPTHLRVAGILAAIAGAPHAGGALKFIFTSDLHYGISRPRFHGASNVDGQTTNRAMIRKMNALPGQTIPAASGLMAGSVVGGIEYVLTTGDYANRMESGVQTDSASWAQFLSDYTDSLRLTGRDGAKSVLLLSPGNHDISNAIGYPTPLTPATDPTSLVGIYNRMLRPATERTNATYDRAADKVNYSRDIGGVHFQFVDMWPDSANRAWMEADLAGVPSTTPVLIFAHSPPQVEGKNFTNPNGAHDINATDGFQNLLAETFKDGARPSAAADIEMRGFAAFLKAHRNIRAYFHGHDNFNEFGTWTGPDGDVVLPCFRVDSPMKGDFSRADETRLSFQLIVLDSAARKLTVREVLWNADSTKYSATSAWGRSKTISLEVGDSGDSLLLAADRLVETDYTVPSWTLLLRARTRFSSTGSAEAAGALKDAIAALEPGATPYSVTANINGDPASRMAFNWLTNAGETGGVVQVVRCRTSDTAAFAKPAISVAATSSAWTTNYAAASNGLLALAGIPDNSKRTYTVHKALVAGLAKGATYSYRVGTPGAWSPIGHFSTAGSGKEGFSFIYFTDPQAQNDDMFSVSARTLRAAVAHSPRARFILSCGDLVETSGSSNSEWEYEQFFRTQQDIWSEHAFAPVMGNHDKSANRNFSRHFNTASTPFDTLMTVPGSVYSFVYGDVLFLAMSYEDYAVPGYLDSLRNWMSRTVAANRAAKWRVAFFHKTMYTGSQSHQSDADGRAVREAMGPTFDSLHVDLALQGHDHIYEVIGPVKGKALVAGAVSGQVTVPVDARSNLTGRSGGTFDVSGGTLYFLNNSAGLKKYEPRGRQAMDSVEAGLGVPGYFGLFTGRFGQTGEPTFSEIAVEGDTIAISTYAIAGSGSAYLFDAIKLVKGRTTGAGAGADRAALRAGFVRNGTRVRIGGNAEGRTMTVEVRNISGSLLARGSSDQSAMDLDLPGNAGGLYLVHVRAGSTSRTFALPNR